MLRRSQVRCRKAQTHMGLITVSLPKPWQSCSLLVEAAKAQRQGLTVAIEQLGSSCEAGLWSSLGLIAFYWI